MIDMIKRVVGSKRVGLYAGARRLIVVRFYALLFIPLFGCGLLPEVKPWHKQVLAKPEMTFGSNELDEGFDDHIYFSKEASSGGRGFGGGGCGCN